MNEDDLLIVGAGPTGLTFALFAARFGLKIKIIDSKEGPAPYSRALTIHPRSLEVLERAKVIDPFLKKGVKVDHFFYHFKKKKVRFSLASLDTFYPYILFLPQSETEQILISYLEEKGIKVQWKTSLVDVVNQRAVIEHENKRETLNTRWIIGCDGAHSTTRHLLNIPFRGSKFSETFLLADISAHGPSHLNEPHFFINKKGLVMLAPIDEKKVRVIVQNVSPKDERDLKEILKERECAPPFEIDEISWLSFFQIHRRIVSQFRKQNAFLMGDAAHIHSPAGGQGMNTGIQEAENLAWKLALVIKGRGNPDLLDSYEIERMPIAKQVIKWTSFATQCEVLLQKYGPFFRVIFYFVLANKKRYKKISAALTGLALQYKKGPLVSAPPHDKEWKGPKSGERAFNVELENGTHLFSLFKPPALQLLFFAENTLFAKHLHEMYGSWLTIHVIKDKNVRKKYAAGPKTLYLIRPDGVVGYRSHSFQKEEIEAYLRHIFKPKQPS